MIQVFGINRVSNFCCWCGIGGKKLCLWTDDHSKSVRPTPVQNAWPVALSAMVVECEWFIYMVCAATLKGCTSDWTFVSGNALQFFPTYLSQCEHRIFSSFIKFAANMELKEYPCRDRTASYILLPTLNWRNIPAGRSSLSRHFCYWAWSNSGS